LRQKKQNRKRALLLFVTVYLFSSRAADGQAPIEVIMPAARRIPLYRLTNDPFRALPEQALVKKKATMADFLQIKEAAAWIRCGRIMQRARAHACGHQRFSLDTGPHLAY
jgi:hypothetical protein